MTDPQQSTAKSIFRPVSPPKRQVMQGKSLSCRRYTLELLPTCENIGLQSHLGSRSSQAHSSTPHPHQIGTPGDPSHAHSHTPDAPLPRTHNPSPPQIRMQFPNRSDSAIQSDTNKQAAQRELHAKLLSTCHGSTSRSPPRGPPWGLRGLAAVPVRGGRARTRTHARLEAVAEPAGPGRGAGGWRQGQGRLRADAPGHTPATRRRRCGGRPRDRGQAAVPVGGGGARAGLEPTRQATRQHTRPHWCGGRRRDWWAWLRCPWAAAGPGRASRSITPSRRLACGDLAGGPPPTGTPRSPARQRIQKRPPGTGWAYLSRLWESNPRPIHYE